MRHSQRHLSHAAAAVVGLTAPALAAVLLTSSVASTASPLAQASSVQERLPHGAPAVVAAPPAPVHHAVAAAVRAVAAPTHRAVVKRVVRTTTHRTTTTRTTTHRTATTQAVSQTAQPSGVDDYPYRTAVGNPTDRWGFTERQCVSFAAWRLAQHGHAITNADNWGSALTWDDTARRLGDTVTTTPRVGAIAQWNAGEGSPYYSPGSATANGRFVAGGYGHVAWVKAVYADGSVLVEQYNMGDSRSYSVMRVKAPRYLLIG